MKDLKAHGTMAASRFLSQRGYEVLEEGWRGRSGGCGVIALDGDVLVFVEVTVRSDATKGFPAERKGASERASREMVAIDYLTGHPEHVDMGIRFDEVSILFASVDRAIIRHHINCMAASEPMQPDIALPEAA